jgi:hypothetical protein
MLIGFQLAPLVILFQALPALLLVGAAFCWYRTRLVERHPNQAVFTAGKVPGHQPDGFYRGSVGPDVPTKGWRGKVFDGGKGTGINQFTPDQRYVFKFYSAPGLRDQHMQVLRIDYKQPGNPWWLRFIVDEIVMTAPDRYLGKVHVQILPGLVFSLLYFELTKSTD